MLLSLPAFAFCHLRAFICKELSLSIVCTCMLLFGLNIVSEFRFFFPLLRTAKPVEVLQSFKWFPVVDCFWLE